ncbi:Metal-dependent hydrolase [Tepidibacter aestuarii]|nr:Metal-dependent hydrolase [Tepidibacter aestuarii]
MKKYVLPLPLNFKFKDIELTIHPTILNDDKDLILVDCGYPYFEKQIQQAMKRLGFSISDITKIIITHHDHDHMGALKEIIDHYSNIEVFCSADQAPYITGKKKSLRLIQAEKNHIFLNDEDKIKNQEFIDMIASVKNINNVTIVNDGDILPYCEGIEIINTSGHMPGHISVYIPKEKTLIAGDALGVCNDNLCIANPQFVLDMDRATHSIDKLLKYDIKKIICYHGGEYSNDVRNSLKRIVENDSF